MRGDPEFGKDPKEWATVILPNIYGIHRVTEQENRNPIMIMSFLEHHIDNFSGLVLKGCLWKLVPGLNGILNTIVSYLALRVLVSGPSEDTWESAGSGLLSKNEQMFSIGTLATVYLGNFLFGWFANYQFRVLRIGGHSTLALRKAIMDTVLQLTPEMTEKFDAGNITSVTLHLVPDALNNSFISFFSLVQNSFSFLLNFFYVLSLAIDIGLHGSEMVMWLIISATVFMIVVDSIILYSVKDTAAALAEEEMEREDDWVSHLIDSSALRPVIQSFAKGINCSEHFAKLHRKFNEAHFKASSFETDAVYFANLVPVIVTAAVMWFAGELNVYGLPKGEWVGVSVATYSTLVAVVKNMGTQLGTLFTNIFSINKGYAAIRAVSTLLNANTIRKHRLGLREYMAAKMTLDCTWMLVGDKVEARCVAPLEPEFEDIVHEGYQEDFGKTVSKVTGDMRRLQAEARARQNMVEGTLDDDYRKFEVAEVIRDEHGQVLSCKIARMVDGEAVEQYQSCKYGQGRKEGAYFVWLAEDMEVRAKEKDDKDLSKATVKGLVYDQQGIITAWSLVFESDRGTVKVNPAMICNGTFTIESGYFLVRPCDTTIIFHRLSYEYRYAPTLGDDDDDDDDDEVADIIQLVFDNCSRSEGKKKWDILKHSLLISTGASAHEDPLERMKKIATDLGIVDVPSIVISEGDKAIGKLAKLCASKKGLLRVPDNHPQSPWARPFSCRIPAGCITALVGTHAANKRTLLRLMARHFVPSSGFIHYPSWWRVRYLDKEPLFFRASLWFNLTFGVQFLDEEFQFDCLHTPGEVANLCEGLGLSPHLVEDLRRNVTVRANFKNKPSEWAQDNLRLIELGMQPKSRYKDQSVNIGLHAEKLSVSDAALITLARALMSSCDLLLISNLLDVLSGYLLEKAMKVLNGMVTDRCIRTLRTEFLDLGGPNGKDTRKKKTVILTSKREDVMKQYTRDKVIVFNPVDSAWENVDVVGASGGLAEEEEKGP